MGKTGIDKRNQKDDSQNRRQPNQVVHQQSDKAAPDSGNVHVDPDQLRRFNAKLIPFRLPACAQ